MKLSELKLIAEKADSALDMTSNIDLDEAFDDFNIVVTPMQVLKLIEALEISIKAMRESMKTQTVNATILPIDTPRWWPDPELYLALEAIKKLV